MFTKSPPSAWSPSPPPRLPVPGVERKPALIVAMDDADLLRYPLPAFNRVVARTTPEIVPLLARERPSAVVLDLDLPTLDAVPVCRAAAAQEGIHVLAVTSVPASVPPLLRAGCHAVLLKPFSLNLLAARLGRLVRESNARRGSGAGTGHLEGGPCGTNRAWPDVACPICSRRSAWSFEFTSHRRMWFACVGCDHVWIGPRLE